MLNANEAVAADAAVPYPRNVAKEERVELMRAYNEATDKIKGQFRDFLADKYAARLPKTAQNAIWDNAWEYGHSAGYHEVESYYIDLANLAETVATAVAYQVAKATARKNLESDIDTAIATAKATR